jgi:N-acetyl-alpha-D-muramate 1-phosphate uridylyltransferase
MKPHGYKALIFAAGRGQRLRPLTDTVPKPLLRVGQKFLIEYQLEALINAGFHDIVINVAWLGEAILTALGDGTRYGCSIRYSVEAEALETVGGIVQALPLLGAKPFATVSADVYTDYSYNKLAAMCEQIETSSTAQVAHFVLANNPPFHSLGDFAIRDGLASRQGDTQHPRLNYAGIAVWHPRIFAQCVRGEKMKLFPWADQFVSAGEVSAEHHCGVWDNIGTIDELNALDARLKSQ